VRTEQVQAAARLAASGLGPALLPDNMVPADINAPVRRLEPPIVRELTAYTRNEWSPPARGFLDIMHGLDWARRPPRAVVIP
jgi:DNA-binding transcriptional LysR family regulator